MSRFSMKMLVWIIHFIMLDKYSHTFGISSMQKSPTTSFIGRFSYEMSRYFVIVYKKKKQQPQISSRISYRYYYQVVRLNCICVYVCDSFLSDKRQRTRYFALVVFESFIDLYVKMAYLLLPFDSFQHKDFDAS